MVDIKKWQLIKRQIVFEHSRMTLAEDTVRLPNNLETSYLRIVPVKNHSVGVIAINAKNEILLQREYSYPPDKILWQLPGGGMNSGESIKRAALRELREESNLTAKKIKSIGFFYADNRRSDVKTIYCSLSRLKVLFGCC